VLAQRLVAVITAELFANKAEILEKTLEVERRAEREVEKRLLGELLKVSGAGGRPTAWHRRSRRCGSARCRRSWSRTACT
jgi:hypothetical protein